MKKVATIRTRSVERQNTRPPSRETETEEVLIEPRNFEDADFLGRREIARQCFTREDLHYHASHALDSVDARIVKDLKAVIGQPPSFDLMQECLNAKLFTAEMVDYLDHIQLLLRFLLPARAAEQITGVPASTLLADYKHVSGLNFEKLEIENDFFGTGLRFVSAEASFLERAVRLATDKAFEPVWLVAHDPARYLQELRRCEFWSEDARLNMRETIVGYRLQKLDARQTARTLARVSISSRDPYRAVAAVRSLRDS